MGSPYLGQLVATGGYHVDRRRCCLFHASYFNGILMFIVASILLRRYVCACVYVCSIIVGMSSLSLSLSHTRIRVLSAQFFVLFAFDALLCEIFDGTSTRGFFSSNR